MFVTDLIILWYLAENDGSYSVENSEITKRADLLTTYINRDPELELQSLYAVQAFVHRLQHPRGE